MEAPRRWIAYDTFKLIVALILLLLFLILLLQRPALPPAASQANLPPAATEPQAQAAPATAAPLPTATATSLPTSPPPPTAAPTSAPTSTPENTLTPTSAPEDTPTPAPTSAAASTAGCKAPAPSRLVAGKTARILSNLNLRSEPKIDNNILSVNPAGAILKVLQGPVCVPYQSSAYLWWQVEAPDGKTGWSAENYLNGGGYYLIPVP